MAHKKYQSRKRTPWDGLDVMTPTQQFISDQHNIHYEQRHPALKDVNEAAMINSYAPHTCPFCGSETFVKRGFDDNGIQRYKCLICNQRFKPTTGTIFDSRKIPISEWIEYCTNIFRYVSLNADSWNNKNAFTTSKYWLEKLFLCLENYQNGIILSGKVWLDETYYSLLMRDRVRNERGNLLRGLSRNQFCIGVATDGERMICLVEGTGKPSQKRSYDTFATHIAAGSTLVHDKEPAHKKLIGELHLVSEAYLSSDLKGVDDAENPLNPVNRRHFQLKQFLNAHSGFNRDELQGYLNLFSFVMNPPDEYLEKVEEIMKMAFSNPKMLRYREQFVEK